MGFLEKIEARRLQEAQKALDEQAETARAKQATDEAASRNLAELEARAEIYIEDSRVLVNLLNALGSLGYANYFRDVAWVSGFHMGAALLQRTPFVRLPDVDRYEKYDNDVPPLLAQEISSKNALDKKVIESGLFPDPDRRYNLEHYRRLERYGQLNFSPPSHNPDIKFLGDNIVSSGRELTEPREVGIEITFSKILESLSKKVREWTTREPRRWDSGPYNQRHAEFLGERWSSAVYVRIRSPHNATITGDIQREADLSNINAFDEKLEQVMAKPARIYNSVVGHKLLDSKGNIIPEREKD